MHAGKISSPTECSLCYCTQHHLLHEGSTPAHERPVLSQNLLRPWQRHMAEKYPHLASSRQLLATRDAELEADMDVPLARRQTLKSAAVPAALAAQSQPQGLKVTVKLPRKAVAEAPTRPLPSSSISEAAPVQTSSRPASTAAAASQKAEPLAAAAAAPITAHAAGSAQPPLPHADLYGPGRPVKADKAGLQIAKAAAATPSHAQTHKASCRPQALAPS